MGIDELKVPQLYPSVRRDDTVRKLHVWCINKHLNSFTVTIIIGTIIWDCAIRLCYSVPTYTVKYYLILLTIVILVPRVITMADLRSIGCLGKHENTEKVVQ